MQDAELNLVTPEIADPIFDLYEYYVLFPGFYQWHYLRAPRSLFELTCEVNRRITAAKAMPKARGKGSRRKNERSAKRIERMMTINAEIAFAEAKIGGHLNF